MPDEFATHNARLLFFFSVATACPHLTGPHFNFRYKNPVHIGANSAPLETTRAETTSSKPTDHGATFRPSVFPPTVPPPPPTPCRERGSPLNFTLERLAPPLTAPGGRRGTAPAAGNFGRLFAAKVSGVGSTERGGSHAARRALCAGHVGTLPRFPGGARGRHAASTPPRLPP